METYDICLPIVTQFTYRCSMSAAQNSIINNRATTNPTENYKVAKGYISTLIVTAPCRFFFCQPTVFYGRHINNISLVQTLTEM